MSRTIAVLDDEEDIVELIAVHLRKAALKVEEFTEVGGFYKFLEKHTPDLIVLDLMLPDADGLEICKDLRTKERFAAIPIIMLTAKGEEIDKVLGLELGADDYITKPFSPRELIARVKAVLRRKGSAAGSEKYNIGELLEINPEKFEVSVNGERIELTTTEFRILQVMALQEGRVFTREQLLDRLWGTEKIVLDRTIDVHVKNLREKLGPAGELIKSIRGIGYKLET